MTEQSIISLVLKMLVAEEDIRDIPYERLEALARRIGRAISGAAMAQFIGADFVNRLQAANAMDDKAEILSMAGHTGEAIQLMIAAEEMRIDSFGR